MLHAAVGATYKNASNPCLDHYEALGKDGEDAHCQNARAQARRENAAVNDRDISNKVQLVSE
jgi:hypothetical protein